MFETIDLKNGSMYNNWNFSGEAALLWDDPRKDSFWTAVNTTLLWKTDEWVIGADQIKTMDLLLTPYNYIEKNNQPTWSLFGIPLFFESKEYQRIFWSSQMRLDTDLRVPKKHSSEVDGSEMVANVIFNFEERQFTFTYFSMADVLMSVGSLKSAIQPVIDYLLPMLGLWFLIALAGVINRNAVKTFETELCKLG